MPRLYRPTRRGRLLTVVALVALAVLAVAAVAWAVRLDDRGVASAGASPSGATPGAASPGAASPEAPLSIVGLGDSVMAGTNCGCAGPLAAYGAQLELRDHRSSHLDNRGENGLTAAELAEELGPDGDVDTQQAVAGADVVVVIVGANDLGEATETRRAGACAADCYDPLIEQMGDDLGTVLTRIDALDARPHVTLVATYWNVYEDGAVARSLEAGDFPDWSTQVTRAVNAEIARQTGAHHDVVVDLFTPFKGPDGDHDPTGLLADDGDHPNAAGVALIGRRLAAAHAF